MDRLTTDTPSSMTETLMNLAYAQDRWVHIRGMEASLVPLQNCNHHHPAHLQPHRHNPQPFRPNPTTNTPQKGDYAVWHLTHPSHPPTESAEQIALFRWAAFQSGSYPDLAHLYHIPNGGHRHAATAGRLRAEGVKPGVPDICLPVPRGQYHGLYIELKRQKGGRISPEQTNWLQFLMGHGYCTAICHGWEKAAALILDYLKGNITNTQEVKIDDQTAHRAIHQPKA